MPQTPKTAAPPGQSQVVDDPRQVEASLRMGQELIVQKEMAADKHWATLVGWLAGNYLILDGPDYPVSTGSIFQNNVLLVRFLNLGRMFGFAAKVKGVWREPPVLLLSWPERLEAVTLSQEHRQAVDLPVGLAPVGPGGPEAEVSGRLRDLSINGGQVQLESGALAPENLKQGAHVHLLLSLPDQPDKLTLEAEIRNTLKREGKTLVGMKFLEGQDKTISRIDHLLRQQFSLCLT